MLHIVGDDPLQCALKELARGLAQDAHLSVYTRNCAQALERCLDLLDEYGSLIAVQIDIGGEADADLIQPDVRAVAAD
jgi:hypothetical protein